MTCSLESCTPLLPCQRAMLATCVHASGSLGPCDQPGAWRVYHCELQGLACMVTGAEPDEAMLELVCEVCAKKNPPGFG